MAAGELGVWLSLRGRGEMVAGLKEVSSGVRTLTRGLKETGAQAVVTDAELSKVYSGRHVAGLRGLGREVSSLHMGLGRLVTPIAGIARAFGPLIGLAGVGGLVGGLHAGVQEATKLQTAMNQLVNMTDVKAGQLPALTGGVKAIAASTGVNAADLAKSVLYHVEGDLNKGGRLSTASALSTTKTIAELSQIGGASTDEVAKSFVSLKSLGLKGTQDDKALAGKLLSIVGSGGTMRFEDLAGAINQGKTAALKAAGLGVNEFGAALATFADGGQNASQSVNTFTTSVIKMLHPSHQGTGVLRQLGMGPLQLAADLRKPGGPINMLKDLRGHLDRLAGGAGGALALDALSAIYGGSKGAPPIFTLLDQLPQLEANYAKISGSSAETFTKAWDVAGQSFAVQRERLKQTATNIASGIGAAMLPELGRITGDVSNFLTGAFTHPALKSVNEKRPAALNAGVRTYTAVMGIVHGKDYSLANSLGLHGDSFTRVTGAVRDIRGLLSDSGRILHDSVLPVFTQVALLSAGAIGVGLHLLKDVTGFLADHSTTTKVLLDSFLAVLAVKTIGNGLSMLAQLPVRIGGGFARVGTTIDGLSHPLAGFQQGMHRTAGTVDESTGRMTRSLGGLTRTLTGGSGALGVLGIAGSAFGGYEVGKSQGKGAGIVTGALGGAAAGSMLGPAGAVAGGVIGGLAGFVGGLNKSTTSLYDFGSAIDADKGKIGTNTGQALTDALGKADPTSLKLLTQAGISGTTLLNIVQRDRGDRSAESRDLRAATTDPDLRAMVKMGDWGGVMGTGLGARNGADQVFKPVLDVLTKLGNDLTLYDDKQSYASTFTPGNPVPTGPPGIGRMTARASGGPVGVGSLYPVNELGVELFAPSRPGTIIPANTSAAMANGASGGSARGGWTGEIHMHIHAAPGMDERALANFATSAVVKKISDVAARI